MSYLLRLTFVCAACFFLVHFAVGLLAWAFSPLAVRVAVRMRASSGARLLLTLRLLPLALSFLAVTAFCIPSYLRYEQDGAESIGLLCSFLAGCGLVLLCIAMARIVWAIGISSRLLAQRAGTESDQHVDDRSLFALVGFLRPRVVISPFIREMLSRSQMEAALLHEEAHRKAHDNLKRLALVVSPALLPFFDSFRALEVHWARLSEWAADDAAVAAHPLRAIALAEALVRVARLSSRPAVCAVASTLVASRDDLSERVQRLLHLPEAHDPGRSGYSRSFATFSIAAAGLAVLLLIPHQQHLLYAVHCAMESLVR